MVCLLSIKYFINILKVPCLPLSSFYMWTIWEHTMTGTRRHDEWSDNHAEQYIFQKLLQQPILEAQIMSTSSYIFWASTYESSRTLPQWKLRVFSSKVSIDDLLAACAHDEKISILESIYGHGVSEASDVKRQMSVLSETPEMLWENHNFWTLYRLIFQMVETIFDIHDDHYDSYKESPQMHEDFSEAITLISLGIESLEQILRTTLIRFHTWKISMEQLQETFLQATWNIHEKILTWYEGKTYSR